MRPNNNQCYTDSYSRYTGNIIMIASDIIIEEAKIEDAEEILALQKLAYLSEAEIYHDYTIPPLTQTPENICQDFEASLILKATADGAIVGSVRGQNNDGCYIGRLMVRPDCQNKGLGTRLMQAIEAEFPQAERFWLMTGSKSQRNIHLYQKLGYKVYNSERVNEKLMIVYLEKINK
jgi:ribosomal protein S18 acetylase RimI-like enzyme